MILKEVADERTEQMKSTIESQKQNMQRKLKKITELDEQCDKIQAQAARVKTDAQAFADKIFAMVEANKLDIFQAVDNQAKESVERLQKQKQEIQDQIKVEEAGIEKAETILKLSTSAEIVQCSISPETDSDKGDQVNHDLESFRQFVFVENKTFEEIMNTEVFGSFKTFLSEINARQSIAEGKGISESATVGLEAQIVVTTKNAQGEQIYQECDYITVEIRNRQGHDCATKAQVQDNKDGTYKISYFAKETGTCQASVKVNGEHVRGSPFKVQVKPRQFTPVLCFGKKGSSAGNLSEPMGVAVNQRNEIAECDSLNDRVQVFRSNGTFLRTFGREGVQKGQFKEPSGITFRNDDIIVADCSNSRVQLFTGRSEYLSQLGGEGSLDHQLKYPIGLSTDSNNNIIVADFGNNLCKVFSPKGHFLRKMGETGCLKEPQHCIQIGRNLFVSDGGEHVIKVFDREGNFLQKFGKKGNGDGEFNEPRRLSMDKAGHLLVCDAGNHRIQVFESNGKFVTKFGSLGNAIGKFNRANSTAVLSDGRIVVTDILNNRIQIFE